MRRARVCGKLGFWRLPMEFSIVMELADNGDVFQKICNHKKDKTYIKER